MCYLPLPTRITHSHGTMRRDRDIAPYRHYTREIRAAHYTRALPGRITLRRDDCPRWLTAAPFMRTVVNSLNRDAIHLLGRSARSAFRVKQPVMSPFYPHYGDFRPCLL